MEKGKEENEKDIKVKGREDWKGNKKGMILTCMKKRREKEKKMAQSINGKKKSKKLKIVLNMKEDC